jgi:GAF domain-containing protein
LISAETDPGELVHGENSEFNCTTQMLIQGLDRQEFVAQAKEYFDMREIPFSRDQVESIYSRLNGNIELLKILIRTHSENGTTKKGFLQGLGCAEFDCNKEYGTLNETQLWRGMNIIETDYESTHLLIQLIDQGYALLKRNTPYLLELSGIAIRQEDKLVFSSDVMESLIKAHYSERRLGNLLALHFKWEDAFVHYRRSVEQTSALQADEFREVESALRSLYTSLNGIAIESLDNLWKLFTSGTQYILGIAHAILFEHGESKNEWKIIRSNTDLSKETADFCKGLLNSIDNMKPGLLKIPPRASKYLQALALPSSYSENSQVILLGDLDNRTVMSQKRAKLGATLLDQFATAYTRAQDISQDRQRLSTREMHVDIIDGILDSLGNEVYQTDQVLEKAAAELRKLRYRRVSFSLVSPERDRIVGIVEHSYESADPQKADIDYPLNDPDIDIQTYTVESKKPIRIKDARTHHLTNHETAKRRDMRGIAVIPMLWRDQVIGNMHIERDDQEIPTEEEVEDLALFAKDR